MKILFAGWGRSGKDCACDYLAKITDLRNGGATSLYLAPHVAKRLGVPVGVAYAKRHSNRDLWYQVGRELREASPGILLNEALSHGDIVCGVRDLCEIDYARSLGVLTIWVHNPRVRRDGTVEYSHWHCDKTIINDGTLEQYYQTLQQLARQLGILNAEKSKRLDQSIEEGLPVEGKTSCQNQEESQA